MFSKLKIKFIGYKNREKYYVLKEEFYFIDGNKRYYLKAGFKTNLASIPWAFRWFLKPNDKRWIRGSVIHDGLYKFKRLSRFKSDLLYYKMIRVDGTPIFLAISFYLALFLFGWIQYNKKG